MPVANLVGELMGTFPRLPYLHAIQLINRAWTRVRDMRLWSWQLVTDAELFAPALITGGTVTTTAFGTTIAADPIAAAALNAASPIPPLFGVPGIGRQIAVGVSSNAVTAANGPLYTIVGWNSTTSTITIDRPFGEGAQSGAQYRVYKAFYSAPALPFTAVSGYDPQMIRPVSLVNKRSGYAITGRRLFLTQQELNTLDPNRGATGDAYGIAAYGTNALGQPIYEFYPAPVTQTTYYLTYYTRWPDVSTTQDFPQVPYGLVTCVMDLARVFAAGWAMANAATYPELQQTNWVAAASLYKQDHADGLKMCLKQDDEIMPQVPFRQGRQQFAYGGSFLQNHDVSSLLLR